MSNKKGYPSKQYINLAFKEKKAIEPRVAAPAIALILVLAALFSKLAVVDRFARVTAAENDLGSCKAQLSILNAKLENYDDVLAEYQKYSINWMDDVEKSLVMKTDMMDLINKEILKNSETRTLSVRGNTISAQLVGLSLTETSDLVDRLYARDDVQDVQVYSATTEETLENQVIVSLFVTMKQSEEGDAE